MRLHSNVRNPDVDAGQGHLHCNQEFPGGEDRLVGTTQELVGLNPPSAGPVAAHDRSAQRRQKRGGVRVRVREAEVPADRADRSHAHVGDASQHLGHGRKRAADVLAVLNLVMRHTAADPKESVFKRDATQVVNRLQIDQMRVIGEPEFHRQQQLRPAVVGHRVVTQFHQQLGRLAQGARSVNLELWQFHCSLSLLCVVVTARPIALRTGRPDSPTRT